MQSIQFALLALKLRFEELRDKERGATGVEYGLLVALIAAVIVSLVATVGDEVKAGFQDVVNELQAE